MSLPYPADRMGARLRLEVERQLLLDLEHYRRGSSTEKLTIDWSNPCQEGHCTDVMGGSLESMSDVVVCRSDGSPVAEGWIDFVHGGGDLPLFVFWLFLDLIDDEGRSVDVKEDGAIPPHIWSRLPQSSKNACRVTDRYDANWKDDPSVKAWRREAG
ncbi:MAG TPA: hypothetical protein VGQ77_09160 [Methylomirabilota bacterium]|jgi:hypothetical protein|nr:hypothetical protein [Methylomirabilota bacterium]